MINLCHFKEDGYECLRIITKIINLHRTRVKKNLSNYFSLKEHNIEKLFSEIEFDNKLVSYDIIFTDINMYNENEFLFTNINFNLAIFDLSKTNFDNYQKILDFNKESKKIFIVNVNSNSTIGFNIFNNFFNLIQYPFIFIDNNLKIINNDYNKDVVKSVNKKDHDSNYKLLYKRYGWDILTKNKFILDILNFPNLKVIESYKEHQILINFISILPNKEEIKTYLEILKYRGEDLVKKKTSKKDIIKNLSIFCSFPPLMEKNYVTNLEILKKKDLMNNKQKSLHTLIKKIKSTGFKTDDSVLTIIYSSCDEIFFDKSLYKLLQLQEINKRVKLKTLDECIDTFETFYNTSEYIIFYNFSWITKNMRKFFNIFSYFFLKKPKKITFYQLSMK